MAGEIFISYRRADQAWARLLHDLLRAEGVEAWYDAQVGAGQDWRLATAKALEASQIFVLLFSENAAQSSDIAKELAAATLEKKLIIPVRLQNIAPKGAFLYELASRNWINAYDNSEAKLAELAKGLAHLVRTGARDESVLPFDHSNGDGQTAPPPRKMARKPTVVAAAVISVIIVSAIAAWLLWPAKQWTVENSRPFISTLALEGEPAFSPNGTMLAYTSGPDPLSRKIYVQNVAGGQGIKITNDAYDDGSPSWASDGARLAYVAKQPGERCRIMVATVPAGEARQVARCETAQWTSLAWQPNTPFLYYFDENIDRTGLTRRAIFRLDLDTGAKLRVIEASPNTAFGTLRISPDSKFLLYLLQDTMRVYSIMIRNLDTGKERILGRVAQTATAAWADSATWSEDSKAVLVSAANGIGSTITAYPADGSAPYPVYTTATAVSFLSAGHGGLLAVEVDISRKNLARAHDLPATQPDVIDPANGVTSSPTFAPDGTLAFLSTRSGTNAVWIMKPGEAPSLLFDAGLRPLGRENFSPDGTKLAIMLGLANVPNAPSAKGVSVTILTADGATVTSFIVPSTGFGLPTWTPDGKALIAFDTRSHRAIRVEIADPARRSPVAPPFWRGVTIRKDGTFATREDKPGIWRIDRGIELLNSKYPASFSPPIAFRGDDVLIPDFNAKEGPRILAQPIAGGPDKVIAYAPGAEQGSYQSKMTANPKTGEIIYVASVQGDANIDLLSLAKH